MLAWQVTGLVGESLLFYIFLDDGRVLDTAVVVVVLLSCVVVLLFWPWSCFPACRLLSCLVLQLSCLLVLLSCLVVLLSCLVALLS